MAIFSDSSLVELLCWRAENRPAHAAYIFLTDGEREEVSLSYEELDRQARAVGSLLQSLDAAGERVLLLYPQGLEYLIAFWGCLYAGAVAVPVYPPRFNQNLNRILSIATNSQAKVSLTSSAILSKLAPLLTQESVWSNLRWIATDRITDDLAGQWQDPSVDRHTVAFLQYTSGSTSEPKGVMVSHGNLLSNHQMLQSALRHPASSPYVSWLPLFHDMGLIGSALQALYVGVPCVLMSPLAFLQKPFRWLRAISVYEAATSGGPNFAYELCVQKITPEQKNSLDLSSWTLAFNGAEPVRLETLDRFYEAFAGCGLSREALYPCYGLAEATVFVAGGLKGTWPNMMSLRRDDLERNRVTPAAAKDEEIGYISCGRTWLGQKIAIVNPETLTRCRPDEVGEIWVSGPNVAEGYWNRPEETEHTFHAMTMDTGEGPFLRTGDLGFLKNEELFITGRLKDIIIIDGRNHYPQDLELTVEQCHTAIRPGACSAFSVEVDGEERLVILAEVAPRRMPESEHPAIAHASAAPDKHAAVATQIVTAIRQAIAEQHDLSIHTVSLLKRGSIPKTSSGKIQRHACKQRFQAETLQFWEE